MKRIKNIRVACFATIVFIIIVVSAASTSGQQPQQPVQLKAVTSPRYSVQLIVGATVIVDNAENKMYVYINNEDGAKLKYTTDLTQAGKPEIKADVAK